MCWVRVVTALALVVRLAASIVLLAVGLVVVSSIGITKGIRLDVIEGISSKVVTCSSVGSIVGGRHSMVGMIGTDGMLDGTGTIWGSGLCNRFSYSCLLCWLLSSGAMGNSNVLLWVGLVAYIYGLANLSYRIPVINGSSSVIGLVSCSLRWVSSSDLCMCWSSIDGISSRISVWLLVGTLLHVVHDISRVVLCLCLGSGSSVVVLLVQFGLVLGMLLVAYSIHLV